MEEGGQLMEKEKKVREEKLSVQPIEGFVFKIQADLVEEEKGAKMSQEGQS